MVPFFASKACSLQGLFWCHIDKDNVTEDETKIKDNNKHKNDYLEHRFSKGARTAGSMTFSIHMLLYMALVLYAPSLALYTENRRDSFSLAIVESAILVINKSSEKRFHPKTTTESVWLPRLTEKEFKLYSKESYDKKILCSPTKRKCATTVKLLRPHKLSDDYLDEYLEEKSTENRTVDRDLNILMINNLIICHLNKSPKCDVPHFELVQETQWGLCWIWEMKCTKCKFISEKYKLFREINTGRPGRKSATINYGFQTGVINCNIGNDSARLLFD
ncbi:SLC5A6 [Mytilus coruscus]|uniref:SLC5A6 n=1 Tax=Mytilus coruscus TaxID=42192 RepID=A0A6J8C811_MYTCO|nr:SLC5A6 [Mytilus coruscus]